MELLIGYCIIGVILYWVFYFSIMKAAETNKDIKRRMDSNEGVDGCGVMLLILCWPVFIIGVVVALIFGLAEGILVKR